jgi:hypothetical protein
MMVMSGLQKSVELGDNMEYTVRYNGKPVRTFSVKEDAQKFMVNFIEVQQDYQKQFQYIDDAVDKSDLKESLEVLQYIMERK